MKIDPDSPILPVKTRHSWFRALLVCLLASFAVVPLFRSNIFVSTDWLFHLYRLMEFDALIRDGTPYPRWAPDFYYGLGYPVFNYYSPLTYYLGEVFRLLGAGYFDSLKLVASVAMVMSGIGAYLYARQFLSPLAGTLAAVVYMYAPYHVWNLYFRGDLPEYLAYTWFPFILWSLTRVVERRRLADVATTSVFCAALILTHGLSCAIFSVFAVIYCLALLWRKWAAKSIRWPSIAADLLGLAVAGALALAISAIYWLPVLAERSLVNLESLLQYDFHALQPPVGEAISSLGVPQALFLALGTATLFLHWRHLKFELRVEAVANLIVAAISLVLFFPVVFGVSENMPLIGFVQFPMRFLAFFALPCMLFSGLIVEAIPQRPRTLVTAVLVSLVMFYGTTSISPTASNAWEEDISRTGSIEFELNSGTLGTTSHGEYLPKWVKLRAETPAVALAALGGQAAPVLAKATTEVKAETVEKRTTSAVYRITSKKGGAIVLNTLYFPGWRALVDGAETAISIDDPSGLIKMELPAGDHVVRIEFVETPLRLFGDGISALAVAALLMLAVLSCRRSLATLRFSTYSLATGRRGYRVNRTILVKAALLLSLAPVWLASKAVYDTAYAPQPYMFPLRMNLNGQVIVEGQDLLIAGTDSRLKKVTPPSTLQVNVSWHPIEHRAPSSASSYEYRPFARLVNLFNQTWAYSESASTYLDSDWTSSEPIVTALPLELKESTPPGVYYVETGFESVSVGQPPRSTDVQEVSILSVWKTGRVGPVVVEREANGQYGPQLISAIRSESHTDFQQGMKLLDYEVAMTDARGVDHAANEIHPPSRPGSFTARAGETVRLSLLWQAGRKFDEDFTVVALLTSGRTTWTSRNSQPAYGTYPTSFWAEGEVVRDQIDLHIPAETPPGEYRLELRLNSQSGPLSIVDERGSPVSPALAVSNLTLLPSAGPPASADIRIQHRMLHPLSDAVSLLGYTLAPIVAQPGNTVHLELYWLANAPARADLGLQIDLLEQGSRPRLLLSSRPVGDAYPTKLWRAGDILRGQYDLVLPAASREGVSRIVVRLVDIDTGQVVGSMDLDEVMVQALPRIFVATPNNPLSEEFGRQTRLLGYDLKVGNNEISGKLPSVTPQTKAEVTIYWRAMAEMQTSYAVFVQVLDSEGKLVAQHDGIPGRGTSPTTGWIVDQVVADTHSLDIPANLRLGNYTLIAGLYDPVTGKRLETGSGEDFVMLTRLRVSREENTPP